MLSELTVDNGEIVSGGGARYRAIYLSGTSERMTLAVLRRLAELAEAGAAIVGLPPTGSPALGDDPGEFRRLVKRLWPTADGVAAVGKGKVVARRDLESALAEIGVPPDFSLEAGAAPDADIQFVHRRLEDRDIYFVANRKPRIERIEARFRVTGIAPQIWRAASGSVEPVSYRPVAGATVVPLEMAPNESFFVVFGNTAAPAGLSLSSPAWVAAQTISGPWTVSFEPGRGAPPSLRLDRLAPLSEQRDAGVKYFSGVATFETRFRVSREESRNRSMMLDLGKVGDVAEVLVNGKTAGSAWKAPYRVNVGGLLRPGTNRLTVRVANLWVNRLIGDQQPGAAKVAYTVIPTYTAEAPLRPSGLIGPVTLNRQEPSVSGPPVGQ
jgi:hypothetical protein